MPRPVQSLNLLDAAAFLRRHLVRIGVWALAFAVVGYLVSYAVPRTYRATASILPPEEEESLSSLQMARRSLSNLGAIGRMSSYFTQVDIAMAVLRSRTVQETLVRKHGLQEAYRQKRMDDAIRTLRENTKIRLATDGSIAVLVEDRDARRAADLANDYFAELDRFNQQSRTFRARRSRVFLEERLAETDSILALAEGQLAAYQKRKGSLVIPPEISGGMSAATDLMARKAQAEIELELMRRYTNAGSEELQRLEARVQELRRQVGELPSTQAGGSELLRRVAVQQQVVAFLRVQLEDARMKEAMDVPTIQVLDKATPPERQVWPRRLWIAAFGGLLGLLVGVWSAMRVLPSRPRPAGA